MSGIQLSRAQVCALLEISPRILNAWDGRGYLDQEGDRDLVKERGKWRRYGISKLWVIALIKEMRGAGMELEIASAVAKDIEAQYFWPVLNPLTEETVVGLLIQHSSRQWNTKNYAPTNIIKITHEGSTMSLSMVAQIGGFYYLPFTQTFIRLLRELVEAGHITDIELTKFFTDRPS